MEEQEDAPVDIKKKSTFDRLEGKIRNWGDTSPTALKSVSLYKQYHRYLPAAFFFGGVAWDSATLDRIDALFDTIFLMTYIVVLGVLIMVALFVERGDIKNPTLQKYRNWYPPAIQFFLGALFSAYFIFYLQSTSIRSEGMIFIVILVVLLIANEFLQSRLLNPYLLFSLYYLACVSFFIFFLPVVFKQLGYGIFLASCVIGLLITSGMLYVLKWKNIFKKKRPIYFIASILIGIFISLNIFYMQNWIPPVPLSMREGDVFRGVERAGDDFVLEYATPKWYEFWINSDEDFYYAEGDTVYGFAAIFAPSALETNIYHAWNHFDESREDWVQTDKIAVEIEGGRNSGYRTFTRKRFVSPGEWRIDVKTEDERVLGRIPFHIIPVDSSVVHVTSRVYK